MKKSIGILAACLLLNGGVQAAELQPDASAAVPQAVTEAAAAQVTETVQQEQTASPQGSKTEQAEPDAAAESAKAQQPAPQAKKEPRVIRKTVKLEAPKENWYLTRPADFTYYVNKERPNYSLAIPNAFGSDLLAGLPASGPMIVRGASDTVAMTFNAVSSGTAPQVFKAALAGKTQLPPPAPVTRHVTLPADKAKGTPDEDVIEITEFEAPAQYTYQQIDVRPLALPEQLENLMLTEAGEYKTFQGLSSQYMQFKCTSAGVPCLLRLTLTQYSGYQYTGFYLFPESQRLTFIPLANYSASSLQCGGKSFFDRF